MKFHTFLIAASAASLLATVPAFAQTNPDGSKTKQASKPENGSLQHTSGTGAAAQKQRAQGGAAFEPQQYGTDWARNRKPTSNNQ